MDPQATLAAFWQAMRDVDNAGVRPQALLRAYEDAAILAVDLFEWLANGGFAPDWTKR
jgi:hypothetical protein